MGRTRWLAVLTATGAAVLALSFVRAWIAHDRILNGEGYREVLTTVNAWGSVAVPILSAGIVIAVTVALGGLWSLRRHDARFDLLLAFGAALAFGLVAATLVPVSQAGQASRIDLSPGWAAVAGTAGVAVMVVAAIAMARPGRTQALGLVMVVVVVLPLAAGGRWLGLQEREGSNQAWSDGSYTRAASDGLPAMTLVIDDGTYRIGDRWSGRLEGLGRNLSFIDDPACPGARGTYHAHGDPRPLDPDLRFVKLIDTCGDGERARVLTTGIWLRDR